MTERLFIYGNNDKTVKLCHQARLELGKCYLSRAREALENSRQIPQRAGFFSSCSPSFNCRENRFRFEDNIDRAIELFRGTTPSAGKDEQADALLKEACFCKRDWLEKQVNYQQKRKKGGPVMSYLLELKALSVLYPDDEKSKQVLGNAYLEHARYLYHKENSSDPKVIENIKEAKKLKIHGAYVFHQQVVINESTRRPDDPACWTKLVATFLESADFQCQKGDFSSAGSIYDSLERQLQSNTLSKLTREKIIPDVIETYLKEASRITIKYGNSKAQDCVPNLLALVYKHGQQEHKIRADALNV